MTQPIPDGFTAITPHLAVDDASAAIEFYERAFGAEEIMRMPGPDGQGIMHAEVRIGGAIVMLNDEFPEYGVVGPAKLGGSPVTIHMYVDDVDAVYAQAVGAGAQSAMPVQDMFWGDRYGLVIDPHGHRWAIATHTEDLTPQQIAERSAQAAPGCEA